jgi:ACS family D-galactonate transporter-like MFS transporter
LRRFSLSSATAGPGFEKGAPEPQSWSLGQLLEQRKVLGLAIGFGAYNYVFYLLLTWLPTYLQQALHLSSQQSFVYTGAPWLVATAADLLLGGVLVDALIRRGWDSSRVRQTVLLTGMVCGLGILGGAFAHSALGALVPISIAIGGLAAAAPVCWSIPALLVPNSSTGRVGSIINFASQVSAIAAPIVTGYCVQRTGNFRLAFFVAAAYLLVGIAAYGLLLGRIEPIRRGESAEM